MTRRYDRQLLACHLVVFLLPSTQPKITLRYPTSAGDKLVTRAREEVSSLSRRSRGLVSDVASRLRACCLEEMSSRDNHDMLR